MGNIAQGFQVFRELLSSDTPAADFLVNTDIGAGGIARCFDGVSGFHTQAPSVW